MFLADTNVISESRKGRNADPGVTSFLSQSEADIFLPVQVIGELESGVEALRQRGDIAQSSRLGDWFSQILTRYATRILTFDVECARRWGVLRGSSDQNLIDKQIAAIALLFDLTLVTRNVAHFVDTGVRVFNPFVADATPPKPKN